MPTIIDNNNLPLDANYSLEDIDGLSGLILESWGPSTRNPEYNEAFEVILGRLIKLGISYIQIYVVSKTLIKAFPNPKDRLLLVEKNTNIILMGQNPKDLRLKIGREQANLKVNPDASGGNRTKRILIHNKSINRDLWEKIANTVISTDNYLKQIGEPTNNFLDLEQKVNLLETITISKPKGNLAPNKTAQNIQSYDRDPKIKAWVLKQAKGHCEVCKRPAPFLKDNGLPYLEVHHVLPLSEGGSDTTTNVVAVCPNCHMQFHYGAKREAIRVDVIKQIQRLMSE